MTGLLNLDSLETLPIIRDWVKRSEKVLEKFNCSETEVPQAIEANVLLQLDHLRQYECVKKAIHERQLSLHGWVYHFENGEVDFLNEESNMLI